MDTSINSNQATIVTFHIPSDLSFSNHSEIRCCNTPSTDSFSSADRTRGPHSLLHNGCRFISGGKATVRGVKHSPQSSAEVKEIVELRLFSPSGSLWFALGWIFPLL